MNESMNKICILDFPKGRHTSKVTGGYRQSNKGGPNDNTFFLMFVTIKYEFKYKPEIHDKHFSLPLYVVFVFFTIPFH